MQPEIHIGPLDIKTFGICFAPGVLFGLYLIFAGIERFLVEFIRRNEEIVAGLTQPQLISLALLALGVAIVVVRRDVPQPATA